MTDVAKLIAHARDDANGLVTTLADIVVAFLRAPPLKLLFEPSDIDAASVTAAVRTLVALPDSTRATVEAQLYRAYCEAIADGAMDFDSPQAQLDWEAESTGTFSNPLAATCAGEVWPLVMFQQLVATRDRSGTRVIVRVEAEAAWDGEHGVVLHFDNGANLVAVSGSGRYL